MLGRFVLFRFVSFRSISPANEEWPNVPLLWPYLASVVVVVVVLVVLVVVVVVVVVAGGGGHAQLINVNRERLFVGHLSSRHGTALEIHPSIHSLRIQPSFAPRSCLLPFCVAAGGQWTSFMPPAFW